MTAISPESSCAAGAVAVLELPVDDPSFSLEKAVCSHGLFMMAPNRWDTATKSLRRPLRLASAPSVSVAVTVSQPDASIPLLTVSVAAAGSLSLEDREALLAQVRRMLRLSPEDDLAVAEFHMVHNDAREKGFGRIFRSPTLFEDMVKCILLCNCQWSRTLSMAQELCNLQLELKSCNVPDFKPKTPPPREVRRKRGRGKKVAINLSMKLMDNDDESSVTNGSVIVGETQPHHQQQKQPFSDALSDVHEKADPPPDSGDFPSPEELAGLDVEFLAARCKLGYRSQRIISLSKSVVECKIDISKFGNSYNGSSCSYGDLDNKLSEISGFGPFTRGNILMCLGFYHRVPADSETIRHLKQFHARMNCNIKSVQNDLEELYGKYAPFQFLAFWAEIWADYEKRFGKMSEMPPSLYGQITASNMKNKISTGT